MYCSTRHSNVMSHDATSCSSHDPSSDTSQLHADVHRLDTSCCMSNHSICMFYFKECGHIMTSDWVSDGRQSGGRDAPSVQTDVSVQTRLNTTTTVQERSVQTVCNKNRQWCTAGWYFLGHQNWQWCTAVWYFLRHHKLWKGDRKGVQIAGGLRKWTVVDSEYTCHTSRRMKDSVYAYKIYFLQLLNVAVPSLKNRNAEARCHLFFFRTKSTPC